MYICVCMCLHTHTHTHTHAIYLNLNSTCVGDDKVMIVVTYTPAAAAKSLRSCPTLCDPVPGTPQARTLEWVAISFYNA